jgi:hypothetical protein
MIFRIDRIKQSVLNFRAKIYYDNITDNVHSAVMNYKNTNHK